jgi:hypothetical protein
VNLVKKSYAFFAAAAIATLAVAPFARLALADTNSTAAIAVGAAAIVGAILMDSNNQPYYVNNGRHVYVSQDTANYYRAHGNNRGRQQQRNGQHGQHGH